MKMIATFAAALLIAGPAVAQSSHAAHHPADKPGTVMRGDDACPQRMQDMSGNMQQMMQMHQQMMGQMAQMMQSMQQHQGMGMGTGMGPGMSTPKTTPPNDGKPH